MERALDPADFMRQPVGRCFVGPRWIIWCHSPTLCGSTVWASPSEEDARAAAEISGFILHGSIAPNADVLMDYRAVDRLDSDVLLTFGALVSAKLGEWAPRIRRMVAILPGGLPGVLIAGAVPSLEPAFWDALSVPLRFVLDVEAALDYLDRPDVREAFAEVQGIVAEARESSAPIDRLHALLAKNLIDATLPEMAQALATTPRTLQRELHDAGSSFSDELRRARVDAAVELLLHTENKIEAIALRVGFGTASRMSAAFRRDLGLTPSELRARRK